MWVVVRASPYSSVVEHPLSKRKVGSSILPGGNLLARKPNAFATYLPTDRLLACLFLLILAAAVACFDFPAPACFALCSCGVRVVFAWCSRGVCAQYASPRLASSQIGSAVRSRITASTQPLQTRSAGFNPSIHRSIHRSIADVLRREPTSAGGLGPSLLHAAVHVDR
jgi:hypothetical protein